MFMSLVNNNNNHKKLNYQFPVYEKHNYYYLFLLYYRSLVKAQRFLYYYIYHIVYTD